MHRYEYDANNRLTHVFTSRDGLIWEKEAKYWYYKHGPLARTEIGDLDVQGMDYAYTLQGWVKGINSNILEAAKDLGRDNMDDVSALEKNLHKNFGEDAASYSIGYFSGDFVAINSNYANFVAGIGSAGLATEAPDLYNGNINHMVTTIRNNAYTAQPQLTAYRYDQLNRIKQMKVRNAISNNVWDGGNWIDRYKTMYDYDANGNIMSLIRHGGLSPFVKIDDMKYHYNSNDNRLQYIDDPNNPTSEPNFSGQSAGNYQYDAIGNMIADKSGKISEIKWNVYGKISQILKDHTEETATPLDDIEFRYDATGNRVAKIIKPAASLNNPQTWKYTFYVRDAQGNILATYTKDGSNEIKLGEYNLYGSSRLGTASYNTTMSNLSLQNSGIYNRTLGLKRYEISNHLGNVLTVFSDKKHTLSNTNRTSPYILSTTDYDPFGMIMNGRDWNPDRYRFGFNGKESDKEVYGEKNSYDFGARIYDPLTGRWLSVDKKSNLLPFESSYSFSNNMPIIGNDKDGNFCVPCALILIGFITSPSVAVAPTGNPNDAIAIQNAYKLQTQWLAYSIMVGGVSTGAIGSEFLKEIGKQYTSQLIGNVAVEGYKSWSEDRKFNLINNVLLESFKSLDVFDAYIGKYKMSKMAKAVLTTSIDISPEEAQVLGLNKDIQSVTIDGLFNSISEYSGNKIVKGRYNKIVKNLLKKGDEVMQQEINKELKKQLGEKAYNNLKEEAYDAYYNESIKDKLTLPKDKVNVDLQKSKCEDCR